MALLANARQGKGHSVAVSHPETGGSTRAHSAECVGAGRAWRFCARRIDEDVSTRKSPKVTVYLGADVAEELCAEAARLEASPSRLIRYAWGLACERIQRARQAGELETIGAES